MDPIIGKQTEDENQPQNFEGQEDQIGQNEDSTLKTDQNGK